MIYCVEGLIVNVLGVEEDVLWLLCGVGILVVFVDCMVEGFEVDLIGFDNIDVIEMVFVYLVECGFDVIYFVV